MSQDECHRAEAYRAANAEPPPAPGVMVQSAETSAETLEAIRELDEGRGVRSAHGCHCAGNCPGKHPALADIIAKAAEFVTARQGVDESRPIEEQIPEAWEKLQQTYDAYVRACMAFVGIDADKLGADPP